HHLHAGNLHYARQVFDGIPERDLRAWTLFISAHTQHGFPRKALEIYSQLLARNLKPDRWLLLSAELRLGREVHGFVVRNAMEGNLFVSSALVNLYASCLSLRQAQLVFDNMSRRDNVSWNMKLAGYQPNTDFVLQDICQEEKVETLCNHSEKLAVAFGILNSNGESPIRVFKNLRICGDCHNAIKVMAKIVGIQIIVRDSLRFHHFENGCCSCRDF
ncbi:hypothetical protein Tsubulata_018013, partial [Turnera subulata]